MSLVASDNTRVVKGVVRKAGLRVRVPGGEWKRKNSTSTLSPTGGLLHAHFGIDDLMIRDLVARDTHCMVRRQAHGKGAASRGWQ